MSETITAPLKWHGGKHYLARRIVSLFPRHLHYCEPFFGGGTVLFERDPDDEQFWLHPHKGVSEIVNDINSELMNFWRTLQSPELFQEFQRHVEATPLSRPEWQAAKLYQNIGNTSQAVSFFVDCRQSLAGRMKSFTGITRSRTRRQMNGNVSEWLGAVEGLAGVHARLKRVVIENMQAVDLIQREDTLGTLFYCDPPYLHETRITTDAYAHEMTREQHLDLLLTLLDCQGKVILSGYRSALYDDLLRSWRRVDWDLPKEHFPDRVRAFNEPTCR